ncbi:MAG: hypothetical protein V3V67_02520 [Myxococcota bacterium]
MRIVVQTALVIHIFAAMALVGSVVFNTLVLLPAMKRVPPAYSAVIHQRIGTGLMVLGLSSLALLGISGGLLLWLAGTLGSFLRAEFWTSTYGWRLALMLTSWLGLLAIGVLSAVWNRTVLEKKLPYTAGLRELEERRAAQLRVSDTQERLAYANFALAIGAALGGALIRALR